MKQLLTLLFLANTGICNAQFIIAGQHSANDYYYDINPDTTLVAIHNTNPWPSYKFDINGDGFLDFDITSINSGGLGGGGSASTISQGISNYITAAFGEADSCISFSNNLQYIARMVRPFTLNDTIGPGSNWDSTWTIAYSNFVMGNYSCSSNLFTNAPSPQYIGIRMINANDTAYGWIKISNANAGGLTIEEYAGNIAAVGIEQNQKSKLNVYPNPSTGSFNFILSSVGPADLIIYNLTGEKIIEQSFSNYQTINLPAAGVYFYELKSAEIIRKGKLIHP
jgi:hypothetical protein